MGKSSPVYLESAEPFLPGICKELISSSLELLGQSDDEEGTVADSLMSNFLRIHDGVLAVSRAHEEQDEDSQCNRKRPHRPARGDRCVLRILGGMVTSAVRCLTLVFAWRESVSSFTGRSFLLITFLLLSKCSLTEQTSRSQSRWQARSSSSRC